jgi:hypothetical protein
MVSKGQRCFPTLFDTKLTFRLRPEMMMVFAMHNEQMETLVGKNFADGTLNRYKTTHDSTKAFIKPIPVKENYKRQPLRPAF